MGTLRGRPGRAGSRVRATASPARSYDAVARTRGPALRRRVGGRCCPAPRIADWARRGSGGCSGARECLCQRKFWGGLDIFFFPQCEERGFGLGLFCLRRSAPRRSLAPSVSP